MIGPLMTSLLLALKNWKAASLAMLLSGCSTAVQVHEPVDCLGIPNHGVTFTQEEKATITDSVLDKFEQIVTIYKQRIITNCELVESHNKLHEVEK